MTAQSRVVLDASAVLSVLLAEQGGKAITKEILKIAVISTVNLAEVQSKLVREGYDPEIAWEDALSLVSVIEPYTAEQAKVAGSLIAQTQGQGLSLGDRSCLALALVLGAPVYTADQIWRNLNVGISIHVIR
jgi:PIN domain nuclease of toxin-antitoxin system